jgi:hypothetical protein
MSIMKTDGVSSRIVKTRLRADLIQAAAPRSVQTLSRFST